MAFLYGIADSEKESLDILPNKVETVDDISRVKKEFEDKLANEGSGFFAGTHKSNCKRQSNKFGKKDVRLFGRVTSGENQIIDELLKLDDRYHILYGMGMKLH